MRNACPVPRGGLKRVHVCSPRETGALRSASLHPTARPTRDDGRIRFIVISGLYPPTLRKRCTFAIDRGMSIFIMEKTSIAAPDSPFVRPAPRARPTFGAGDRVPPMAIGTGASIEDLAHELFEVVTQICLS